MTPEQIREIVKITLDELTQRKLIKNDYQNILKVVEKRLKDFFNHKDNTKKIGYIFRQLSDDQYLDVIYYQYRDHRTLEYIAEALEKDVSTIKRNKRRLIMSIYERLEE